MLLTPRQARSRFVRWTLFLGTTSRTASTGLTEPRTTINKTEHMRHADRRNLLFVVIFSLFRRLLAEYYLEFA
jgi:hypothetical protein